MTRINFYVMSVASQLEFFTGDAVLADRLTVAFTVILPLGGFIGKLLLLLACIKSYADSKYSKGSPSSASF